MNGPYKNGPTKVIQVSGKLESTVTVDTTPRANGLHEIFVEGIKAKGIATLPDYSDQGAVAGRHYPMTLQVPEP